MSEVWRETFCMSCGCGPSEPHHHNCATHEQDWVDGERRMDAIGANGNDGLHYAEDSDCGSALSQALDADTGAHYRYSYKGINLDPYRIADIYNLGGGPREHMTKKLLRGTSKGGSERRLIGELRDALDRWEQMLEEDGE